MSPFKESRARIAEAGVDDDGPSAETPNSKNVDGAFRGSFAGTGRDITEHYTLPWYRRRAYYLEGWTDAVIWRSAIVECVATACMIYVSGQFGMTLMNSGITQVAAYVGIFNTLLLASFIYATCTATGGHLNPTITLTTILCGLTPVSRGVVLMGSQVLGGVLAGGVLLGCWGREKAVSHMGGGNFFDPREITPGQVLLTEIMSSLALLVLSIGTGLDPRQQVVYGRQLGPLLVGLSLGLVTCASTGTAPGYTGPSLNPARAIGLAVAGSNWQHHWVWWLGPAVGSVLVAFMYSLAPPFHADKPEQAPPTESLCVERGEHGNRSSRS